MKAVEVRVLKRDAKAPLVVFAARRPRLAKQEEIEEHRRQTPLQPPRSVMRVSSDGRPKRSANPGHKAVPLLT
jgi:hypothetical protein